MLHTSKYVIILPSRVIWLFTQDPSHCGQHMVSVVTSGHQWSGQTYYWLGWPVPPTPTQSQASIHIIKPTHYLQEHPGLRGTPLAMMAALCNKTASMSPPPLADAAVGKGFHPWKNKGSPEASGSGSRTSQGSASAPTTTAAFSSPPHQATTPSPSYGTITI